MARFVLLLLSLALLLGSGSAAMLVNMKGLNLSTTVGPDATNNNFSIAEKHARTRVRVGQKITMDLQHCNKPGCIRRETVQARGPRSVHPRARCRPPRYRWAPAATAAPTHARPAFTAL